VAGVGWPLAAIKRCVAGPIGKCVAGVPRPRDVMRRQAERPVCLASDFSFFGRHRAANSCTLSAANCAAATAGCSALLEVIRGHSLGARALAGHGTALARHGVQPRTSHLAPVPEHVSIVRPGGDAILDIDDRPLHTAFLLLQQGTVLLTRRRGLVYTAATRPFAPRQRTFAVLRMRCSCRLAHQYSDSAALRRCMPGRGTRERERQSSGACRETDACDDMRGSHS